jgi:hypothetical protein
VSRDIVFDSFLFIVDAALLVIRFLKTDRHVLFLRSSSQPPFLVVIFRRWFLTTTAAVQPHAQASGATGQRAASW